MFLTACSGIGRASEIGPELEFLREALALPAGQVEASNDASFGRLINEFRAKNGVGEVTFDPRLDAAAQAHADDMLARDYFGHESPEGTLERDRIAAQGYDARNFGENLAQGQSNEATALVDWINSPSHLRLLQSENVNEFGLATAGSGTERRWVLVMAEER